MKVLIADDEAVSRWLLESSLRRWGYDVVIAADGNEASRILEAPDAPTLVIFDWLMPGLDGLQLTRKLRSTRPEPYTYVLLLTTRRTQQDVIEGLEAGADDYITKPFDPQELKVRIRTGKRILFLMEQVIAGREALRDQANRDALTGLWNRGAIYNMLETEIGRAGRQSSSLGVIMVDVDHFKRINDSHGHLAGDAVLRETAGKMTSLIRPYDAVGRLGGEEFLILLPGCDDTNAVSQAERLRAAIHRMLVSTDSGPVQLSVSMGVTTIGHGSYCGVEGMIRAADEALYRAKHKGRNRVELAKCQPPDGSQSPPPNGLVCA